MPVEEAQNVLLSSDPARNLQAAAYRRRGVVSSPGDGSASPSDAHDTIVAWAPIRPLPGANGSKGQNFAGACWSIALVTAFGDEIKRCLVCGLELIGAGPNPLIVTADFTKTLVRHQIEFNTWRVWYGRQESSGSQMTHMPNSTNFTLAISAKSALADLTRRAEACFVRTNIRKSLIRMAVVLSAGVGIVFGAAGYGGDGAREGQVLIGGPDNNWITGGPGIDMAAFSGSRWAYVIFRMGEQVIVIGPDGEDRLTNVEVLHFDDMTLNLAAALSRTLSNGVLENIPVWHIAQRKKA